MGEKKQESKRDTITAEIWLKDPTTQHLQCYMVSMGRWRTRTPFAKSRERSSRWCGLILLLRFAASHRDNLIAASPPWMYCPRKNWVWVWVNNLNLYQNIPQCAAGLTHTEPKNVLANFKFVYSSKFTPRKYSIFFFPSDCLTTPLTHLNGSVRAEARSYGYMTINISRMDG